MKKINTKLPSRTVVKEYRNSDRIMTNVVDYYDDFGKRKQKTQGTGITEAEYKRGKKKEVEAMRITFALQVEQELKLAIDKIVDLNKLTVFEYLEQYQQQQKLRVTRYHNQGNTTYIKFLKEYFHSKLQRQDMLLKQFALSDKILKDFYEFQSERKCRTGNISKTISDSTLWHIMTYFNCAFKRAYKSGLLSIDITKDLKRPKVPQVEAKYLPVEEFRMIIEIPITNRLDCMIVLTALLGGRRSEMLGLRYDDVDPTANTISFRRKVLYYESADDPTVKELEFSNTMKYKTSNRTSPLNARMHEMLDWLKTDEQFNRQKHGSKYNQKYDGFLCVKENGDFFKPDTLSRYMHTVCKRLEIPYCNFHGLRHSLATMMLKAGAHMKEVQVILGHSNYNTTADTYSHVDVAQKGVAYNRLENFLGNGSALVPQNNIAKPISQIDIEAMVASLGIGENELFELLALRVTKKPAQPIVSVVKESEPI